MHEVSFAISGQYCSAHSITCSACSLAMGLIGNYSRLFNAYKWLTLMHSFPCQHL